MDNSRNTAGSHPEEGDGREVMHEWGMLLTFQELMLILQSMGVDEIRGIYMDVEPVTDEEVIQIMYSLVQKGILTAKEDSFQLERITGRMIRCMGWPDWNYLTEIDGESVYCYEKKGDFLITRISPLRPQTIEMTLQSVDA